MANKQIHELSQAPSLRPEDQILISNSAQLTRRASLQTLPFRSTGQGATDRTLSSKLDEFVSVVDFGAVGDGVVDDTAAFQAAVDNETSIYIPKGVYRLASQVNVKPGRTLWGAGRGSTEILAEASLAFVFHRNEGAFAINTFAADDWNRSSIADLTIRMTTGGLRVFGHEFRAIGINFFGGAAVSQDDEDGWCVDMVDANECRISNINAGYGGGTSHSMNANGVRWRALKPGVNYGDSLLDEVSVKLAAANTVAILIDGHQADPSKVVNNIVLQRIQVNAPQGGSGQVPLPGTTGIKLWNGSRICLIDCDVEVLDVAFEEYSEVSSNAGACVANTYIGCIAHYSTTNYKDSNETFSRSVIQRNFIGCDNVAPLSTGSFSGDGGRCQDGDAFLQGTWLFNNFGEPSVQLRSHDKDVLLVTGDHRGEDQADADGHPRQPNPYFGFLFELTSKQSAKLTRPIAINAIDPDDAEASLQDVRLEIGNGQDDARGELARIQFNDPVLFRARTNEPLRPMDGLVHHAAAATALPSTGDWYMGPGLYGRINGGEYPPIAVQRGAVPERERNTDFTVTPADFGKIIRVNNGGDRVIAIEAGIVPPGQGGRRLWILRQGAGGVRFVGGTNVTIHATGGQDKIARQYQMVEVLITANDQGETHVYLAHIMPDALEPFDQPLHWTNGGAAIPPNYLGKLVRISAGADTFVEVTSGLVPEDLDAVTLKIMKSGIGNVEVRPGAGMTVISPTGTTPFTITQTGKIVELVVTSSTAAQQPNHVYIID